MEYTEIYLLMHFSNELEAILFWYSGIQMYFHVNKT